MKLAARIRQGGGGSDSIKPASSIISGDDKTDLNGQRRNALQCAGGLSIDLVRLSLVFLATRGFSKVERGLAY